MKNFSLVPIAFALLLLGCDSSRELRPITVAATPDMLDRLSCQALTEAERKPQEEVVLVGTAEHGRPDVLRVKCDGLERVVIFALMPSKDDLGMKELEKTWRKATATKFAACPSCPKYDVTGKFVGTLRADPADATRLLFLVRTADKIHRKPIRY